MLDNRLNWDSLDPRRFVRRAQRMEGGELLYAIGDIHGELEHLERLLGRIQTDAAAHGLARPRLVFLGDYGDRGPNSKGVYDLLASSRFSSRFDAVFLAGNHERMLLAAERMPDQAMLWLANGGAEFIESYGFDFRRTPDKVLPEFFATFPDEHRALLARTRLWHAEAGYLFVHAGIDPRDPTARAPEVLTWIREPFLSCTDDWGITVIHGHTPARSVMVSPNRIAVDTGCGHRPNNPLSAVVLECGGPPLRILESMP